MKSQLVGKSEKQKCFDVLKDLETTYIDLSTGHKWNVTIQSTSVFPASADLTKEIYALATGKDRLPYDEWLKNCLCDNCGKKGHIPSKCPEKPKEGYQRRYNNNRRGDRDRRKQYDQDGRADGDRREQNDQGHSQKTRDIRRLKNAYKASIKALDCDSSSDEESDASASLKD